MGKFQNHVSKLEIFCPFQTCKLDECSEGVQNINAHIGATSQTCWSPSHGLVTCSKCITVDITNFETSWSAGDSAGKYNSVVDCFAKTFRNEGLRAFYNGYVIVHCYTAWQKLCQHVAESILLKTFPIEKSLMFLCMLRSDSMASNSVCMSWLTRAHYDRNCSLRADPRRQQYQSWEFKLILYYVPLWKQAQMQLNFCLQLAWKGFSKCLELTNIVDICRFLPNCARLCSWNIAMFITVEQVCPGPSSDINKSISVEVIIGNQKTHQIFFTWHSDAALGIYRCHVPTPVCLKFDVDKVLGQHCQALCISIYHIHIQSSWKSCRIMKMLSNILLPAQVYILAKKHELICFATADKEGNAQGVDIIKQISIQLLMIKYCSIEPIWLFIQLSYVLVSSRLLH